MNITSSYKVQITGMNRCTTDTFKIFRSACCYVTDILKLEWNNIENINGKLNQKSFVEKLIHNTKNNKAKYDFDDKFHKLPSYMRRSVVASSIGRLQSYVSNGNDVMTYKNSKHQRTMPCLYNGVMFKMNLENYTAKIKLYNNNDWVWQEVKLKKTDVDYLIKKGCDFSAPIMVRQKGKIYLQFTVSTNVKLSDKKDIITAVDLGLNHDAVCSIMKKDGTVLDRKFINFPSEKDHMNSILEHIRLKQKEGLVIKHDWSYYKLLNKSLAGLIASAIVEFSKDSGSDVIVFEHLNMNSKSHIKGCFKQRAALWRKNDIQNICEHKAHKVGIRLARVFAKCTSALAFDGSGFVQRGQKAGFTSNKLCRFNTGKVYNADLSASYNIGARYFIKQTLDKLSNKNITALQAKVPDLSTRTTCTLDTLIKLNAELCA